MTHKHEAKDLFPTWYKTIDPAVEGGIVTSRIGAITNLLANEDIGFWLDVVRVSFGILPVSANSVSTLENAFKAEDVNFPLVSNENIVKTLSEILLCFLFESSNTAARLTAMAVTNTVFFGQFDKSPIPFYDYAGEFLISLKESTDDGHVANQVAVTAAIEGMEAEPEDEVLMDYTDQVALIKTVQYLYDKNAKLQQETNILWWLFGQYSISNKAYFSDVGIIKMVLASALELSELNKLDANFSSARHLLNRALIISNENKKIDSGVSVAAVFDTASEEIRKSVLAKGRGNLTALTPCILALSVAIEFDDPAIWKNALKSKLPNVNIEAEFNHLEIAFQVYNELMFLSNL